MFTFDVAKLRWISVHCNFFLTFLLKCLRQKAEFATNSGKGPEICRKLPHYSNSKMLMNPVSLKTFLISSFTPRMITLLLLARGFQI